jgi:imidazolonepropionase-like amidohydrolase
LLAFALCIGQTPLSAPAKERIIRRLSSVSCLLSAIGMLVAMCASAEPKSQLALIGGMLLDGYGGAPVHHAAILVEGNRIVAAGPASEIEIPPGTPVIDTRGETMMPGMIETHAHLVIVGHGDYERWFKWLDEHRSDYPIERVMGISARQLLSAGITSAVDLGAPLKESVSVRDRIQSGQIPGPRLSVSGPWLIREAAIFPPMCQVIVHTPAEAVRATEDNIRGGADVIKLHGGLSLEEYKAIVEVAHRHHVKVHAHVYQELEVRDAFSAGVDVLQHAGSGMPPFNAALIKDIAESGRPVVLTAARRMWVFPATREFPERLEDPELEHQFPPDMWNEVHDSFKRFHTLGVFKNREQEEYFGDASIGQWIRAGAVIGMGTDSGTPLNFHRDALWREAKVFVDHGMPAARVITALTWINARIFGKERELGTIEPGKLADITVIKGNPLFDIVALSNVDVVIKDGVPYRDSISVDLGTRSTSR